MEAKREQLEVGVVLSSSREKGGSLGEDSGMPLWALLSPSLLSVTLRSTHPEIFLNCAFDLAYEHLPLTCGYLLLFNLD